MTSLLILSCLLLPSSSAQEVASSSAAAPSAAAERPPVFGAPLRLRIMFDERGQPRGELGFSLRWTSSDLPGLPLHAARLLLDPFGTTTRAAREVLSGADVGFYSTRFRTSTVLPAGVFMTPLVEASGYVSAPARQLLAPPGSSPDSVPARLPDRRHRLDLSPVREEIERSLRRDLQRAVITAGFNLALPSQRSAPYAEKEAVFRSVREAGDLWEEDLR
ncbi:MAG: hypothetical protein HY928_12875 [Elusimicrobia bacterium]|nr:hypothetical protein [Elusimicrobiota bacterium]